MRPVTYLHGPRPAKVATDEVYKLVAEATRLLLDVHDGTTNLSGWVVDTAADSLNRAAQLVRAYCLDDGIGAVI